MDRESALVKEKWMRFAPQYYWGDDLDVRYYLIKKFKDIRGKRILDVGCGPGILLSALSGDNQKTGIDYSPLFIALAKQIDSASNFIEGDILKLPFKNSTFDVIIAANVLPGVDFAVKTDEKSERRKVISEIYRILKPGGKLYLTTPNKGHPYYWKKHKLTYPELVEVLQPHFEFSITGWNPIPLPPKLFAWLPGIEHFLKFLEKLGFFKDKGRYFYVEATKR